MTASSAEGSVLSQRQLNRALLARQKLLEKQAWSVREMLHHLVGMQAQEPPDPYVALWSRIAGFRPDDLSQLILDRSVVRTPVIRTTIHLVTDDDALKLQPLTLPLMARTLRSTAFGKGTQGVDYDALVARARELMEEQPRTMRDLGKLLQEMWPGYETVNLARVAHYSMPLVQVPPRGTWGARHQATWTTLEHWLGRPLETEPSIDEVVLRYLAAFGPATSSDIRTWSGLTGLREVIERLRPQLRTFRDERGRELLDVPDGPLPDPETPAPPRFFPEYDNALLSHADRTRIVSEEDRKRLATPNYVMPGTFLVDGYVSGTWWIDRNKESARISLNPLRPIPEQFRQDLEAEADRLLAFLTDGAADRDVLVQAPES